VGIRPFLPALVVGALGAAHAQINFNAAKGNDFAFLQKPPFLIGMVVGAIVLAVLDRRLGRKRAEGREMTIVLALVGAALGAIFFAGSLCRGGYAIWPGFVGGVVCAAIGVAATRPLFARVRARLDESAAAAVPLYAEAAGLVLAALSVVAPPIGVLGLLALLWLLWAGRGRGDQKYAGLRILR
jgi:MFS family permease